MSTSIDQRVVEMRFDNAQFERNISQSTESLEKLKQALQLDEATRSFEELEKAANNADFSGVAGAIDGIGDKFNALKTIASGALSKLGVDIETSLREVQRKIGEFSLFGQTKAGFGKYSQITQSVQTIAAAGYSMDEVARTMEKLTWFADETSYGLDDMTSNIAKFTAQNVNLQDAATAMEGIATWSARSGQGPEQAARAMYNLAQALSLGAVTVQDWKSIEIANMATAEFKSQAIDAAVALDRLMKVGDKVYTRDKNGKADKEVNVASFRTTLAEKWFDDQVLLNVLQEYGKATDLINKVQQQTGLQTWEVLDIMNGYLEGGEEYLKTNEKIIRSNLKNGASYEIFANNIRLLASEEYQLSRESFEMAQNAITLGQALDYVKDAASTAWANIFGTIFGNFEQSKNVWSNMAEDLGRLFVEPVTRLLDRVKTTFQGSYEQIEGVISSSGGNVDAFRAKLIEFMKVDGNLAKYVDENGNLINKTFQELFESGELNANHLYGAFHELADGIIGDSKASGESLEELTKKVYDVIRGNYGNGPARKAALGDDYERIQNLVNRVLAGGAVALEDLSEAELKNLGLTEDEAAAFKTMFEEIESGESSIDDLMAKINQTSGRALFAETIHNFLSGIADLLDIIRETWDEAFPNDGGGWGFLDNLHTASEQFVEWVNNSEGLRTTIWFVIETIKILAATVKGILRLAWTVLSGIGSGISWIDKKLRSLLGTSEEVGEESAASLLPMSDIISNLIEKIVGFVDTVVHSQVVADIFSFIASVAQKAYGIGKAIVEWFQPHIPGLVSLFESLWETLKKLFAIITENEHVQEFWSNLKTAIENFGETAGGAFDTVTQKVTEFFKSFLEDENAQKKFDDFVEKVTGGLGNVKELLSGNWWKVDLTNLIPDSWTTGNPKENLKNGILGLILGENNGKEASTFLKDFSNTIKNVNKVTSGNLTPIKASMMDFGATFSDVFGNVEEKLTELDLEKLATMAIGGSLIGSTVKTASAFKSAAEAVNSAATALRNMSSGLSAAIPNINPAITAFSDIEKAVANRINKQKFIDVAKGILMIAGAIAIVALSFLLLSRVDPDRLTTAVIGMVAVVAAIGVLLVTMGLVSKFIPIAWPAALAIALIPIALMSFAVAFMMLSFVPWKKIGSIALAVGMTVLTIETMMEAISAFDVPWKSLAVLMVIPIALILFGVAFAALGRVDWRKIPGIALSIAFTVGTLALLMEVLEHFKVSWSALAILTALPIALMAFAVAFSILGKTDWTKWPSVAVGLGTTILTLLLAVSVLNSAKKSIQNATPVLVALGAMMVLLAFAMKIMMSIPVNSMSDVAKLVTAIITMLLVIKMMGGLIESTKGLGKNSSSAAGTIMAMAVAMAILAAAMFIIAIIPSEKLGGAVLAITTIIGIMSLLIFASKNAKDVTKNIYAIAIFIGVLAGVLALLASLPDQEALLRATGCVALIMAMLAFVMGTVSLIKNNNGLGSIIAIAATIAVLGAALYLLAGLPATQVLSAGVAIAAALGTISLALFALSAVGASGAGIGVILSSLLGLGATCLMVAASVWIFALGLDKLLDVYERFSTMIAASESNVTASMNGLAKGMGGSSSSIVDSVAAIAASISGVIVGIATAIGDNAVIIVDAIVNLVSTIITRLVMVIPELIVLVTTLVTEVCGAITTNLPLILSTIMGAILMVLLSLKLNARRFAEIGIDIIIRLIEGINNKLEDLVQAGVDTILSLLRAIAAALRGNKEEMADALIDVFSAALEGLGTLWEKAKAKGKEILDKILEAITGHDLTELLDQGKNMIQKIKDGISQFDFLSIGSDILQGLIDGIKDNPLVKALMDAGEWLAKKFSGAFQKTEEIASPSKLFKRYGNYIDEGLILGIKEMGYEVEKAGSTLGRLTYDSVANSISDVDELFSGLDITGKILPVNGLSQIQNGLLNPVTNPSAYQAQSSMVGKQPAERNTTTTFNIYQQPGQDSEDLARIINRELGRLLV